MTQDPQKFLRDEQASGRFLAAVGGVDEAELVHFRALVASEAYAIAALNLNRVFVSWSRGAEALFGYTAGEMVGNNLAVLLTEVDAPLAQLERRVGFGETVELDTRLRKASGQVFNAFLTATPVRSHSGEVVGVALLIRDVSQAKEMERRLRETSQLEAMGRVAAGIAHKINHVLAVVQAYAEFVAEGELTPAQAADLKQAQQAAQRGAVLTSQLLSLKRDRDVAAIDCDLNQLVRGMAELLRRASGAGIQLTTSLASSPLKVRTPPGRVDQLLLNLVLNARDAMPGGGALRITLESAVVGPGHPVEGRLPAGAYAKLAVQDSGVGMDSATLERIFEPFFTTKAKASGLGLLIVSEAAHELGGAIFVDSVVDVGSTFTVYLPLLHATSASTVPRSVAPSADATGAILVVDSDAVLRSAVRRILQGAGYHVLQAADADEADALLRSHSEPVAAVITDLGGASGSVAQEVSGRWPELRRVYLSGDLPSPTRGDDAVFVAKPFAAEHLLAAVKQVLKRPPTVLPPPVAQRRPVVLIVDEDVELGDSLARVLAEAELEAHTSRSGLHALQLLKKMQVDVLVTDHATPGMEGTKLLELALTRFPTTARILFTAQATPNIVMSAVNRGRVAKVLLKNMHPVAIRDEIAATATEAMRRHSAAIERA